MLLLLPLASLASLLPLVCGTSVSSCLACTSTSTHPSAPCLAGTSPGQRCAQGSQGCQATAEVDGNMTVWHRWGQV